ncbi:zf-HC2 domain-containing protein, partial [Acidobacteria bacterium AH-259-O06]|nr:zf-HC2 domain-containing protein [Acidobacteria bacterium AH-259-O06]
IPQGLPKGGERVLKLVCFWLRPKLSPYLDREISSLEAQKIKAHLEHCPECQTKLEELQGLGRHLRQIQTPQPSPHLWENVLKRGQSRVFREDPGRDRRFLTLFHPRLALPLLIMGAFIALMVMLIPELSFLRQYSLIVNQAQAIDIGLYLDELKKGPSARTFDQKHQAFTTSADQARRKCHFGVVIPASLPGGYRLVQTKLLKSLCCFATQNDYRSGENIIYVFELPPQHPIDFGRRELIRKMMNGLWYSQIKAENLQVMNWEGSDVNLTLVGNLLEEELLRILKYLTQGKPG